MDKFKQKYRTQSARLSNWDYGSNGAYFVTICTQDRVHYFGEIKNATVIYSHIGEIAHKFWTDISSHFPFVIVDELVIMPNHIHGVLFFDRPDYNSWKPNRFAPQSQNLASVIRGFKAAVKKYATLNNIEFIWQPRYYDRVVRNEGEWNRIHQYIFDNPFKWEQDRDNPENLYM